MRIAIIVAAAVGLMTTSCGLYSKYEGVDSVTKEHYDSKESALDSIALAAENGANLSWRETFTEPELQLLIDEALKSNSNLQEAIMRIGNAETQLKASRLAYLPSLTIGAEGGVTGLVDGSTSPTESYAVPLTASWEVDIFGKKTNAKEQAKMLLEQQFYIAQGVQTELVASVANYYYTIAMRREQIAIAEQTVISWQKSVITAKAMMDAGMMTQAGVEQIEAGLYGVELSIQDLAMALSQSENAMCSLLGSTPRNIKSGRLTSLSSEMNFGAGIPLLMLSTRPDIMAAEAELAASFYSRNIARSNFYPTLTITGSASWTNNIGDVILNPAEAIYSAVGQLVQPIFNRGLNKAQLEVAKNNMEISRISFEQKLLDAGIEVNDALYNMHVVYDKSAIYERQVDKLDAAARGTMLLMEHGTTTYLEVLTAQQSLYNAQLQQLSNSYDQHRYFIALYKAIGGGRF